MSGGQLEEQSSNTALTNQDELENFIQKFGGLTESYWFYNHTIEIRYDPAQHCYLLPTKHGLEEIPGVSTVSHIVDKSHVLLPWAVKMMAQKIMAGIPSIDGTVVMSLDSFEKFINECKTAHKERLTEAGEIGHVAHAWIETYIKSILAGDDAQTQLILDNTPEDMRAKSACIASLDWIVQHNVRFLSTERKIYSLKHKYAGTMDGLCLTDSCDNPNCCKTQYKDHLTVCDWKTSNYLYNEFLLQTAAYLKAYEEETGEVVTDRWIIRLSKDTAEFDAWHMGPETIEDDWKAFEAALVLTRSMQIVDERMVEQKEEHRVWKKRQKEAEKSEIYKVACPKSGTYKGARKTKCNGTQEPCQACAKKYEETQKDRLESLVLKNAVDKPEEV
jgi:hypothetical protein